MCSSGCIVNYLKAMLGDARHDVPYCCFQAADTPGREILQYGNKPGGFAHLDGQRIDIRAGIQQIGGFSAHADQRDLLNFIGRIPKPLQEARIVHGDDGAKATLTSRIKELSVEVEVEIITS